ncbi:hypothetical protein [Rhodovulum kholense]|uniref:hypothetical protein n=1 Tax=Rhodovulum kholense TaxID=453584 RepID=UPI001304A8C2|nr:hypothetical protein [Rhodovulum kholense]
MGIVGDGDGVAVIIRQLPAGAWRRVVDEPARADAILDRPGHGVHRRGPDGLPL